MTRNPRQDNSLGIWCENRECKAASLTAIKSSFVLEEILSGELTKTVYGANPYTHRVLVQQKDVQTHLCLSDEQATRTWLTDFYRAGGMLADLLDMLETAHIRFLYEVWNEEHKKWCAV